MAPASWIQRLAAACASLALASTLLAPPPSLAASERSSDAPAHEVGTGGNPLVGVVPSPPKRSADGTLLSLQILATPNGGESSSRALGANPVGGEAPALARWRLAHGTSTSSP